MDILFKQTTQEKTERDVIRNDALKNNRAYKQ